MHTEHSREVSLSDELSSRVNGQRASYRYICVAHAVFVFMRDALCAAMLRGGVSRNPRLVPTVQALHVEPGDEHPRANIHAFTCGVAGVGV